MTFQLMLTSVASVFISLALLSVPAAAAEQQDAEAAAKAIISSLDGRQYKKLWDAQTSAFFKKQVSEDSFLANMSMGRAPLGKLLNSRFIDVSFSQHDPATGFQGRIYAFNYLNTYAAGKFYERIVVVKEPDGQFRLAGIWGNPAPNH